MQVKPDIVAEVHLLTTENGGRQGPTPSTYWGCLAKIEGEYWDCSVLLDEVGSLAPGTTTVVPIKFVSPVPGLKIGNQFRLWEGSFVGTARILSVSSVLESQKDA